MVYEMTIGGFAGTGEALGMQEPIKRVLCPVEDHDGPCEVPWGFSVSEGDEPGAGDRRVTGEGG
jgi:hypothetical protein